MIGKFKLGLIASLLTAMPATAQAQDAVGKAVDVQQRSQTEARNSQQRVDRLDDQTRQMLEKYRAATWQAQQLEVYADQLEKLVTAQEQEKESLQTQLQEVEVTEREILPLTLRMLESLEKFVALDLPFLQQERKERLGNLRQLMSDPEAGLADRFRRLLEAYQVEADYGRALGAERTEIQIDGQTRAVDLLHVGRVSLYFLSLDGSEAGQWNAKNQSWQRLDDRHANSIRRGLKVARESIAAELLTLPTGASQ